MNTLEVLKQARGKIANEQDWTRYLYSDNRDGHVAYCALGAIRATTTNNVERHSAAAVEAAIAIGEANRLQIQAGESSPYWWKIGQYNDTHSHTDVLRLFDKAIAKLEKELPMAT